MNSPISAVKRFWRHDGGEAAVGFALILPALVAVSLGTLEFTLSVFDYHRASEATRRGARIAAIEKHMVNQGTLMAAGTVTCTSTGTAISCGGADAVTPETFSHIVGDMQAIMPSITAANVEIEYTTSGIGDSTTPGGIHPLVTVRLRDLRHDYMMLSGLPGLGDGYTFQPLTTSRMSSGMGPTASSTGGSCPHSS